MEAERTMFADVTLGAWVVYPVTTRSSVYQVGIHHEGGRRVVVVRGASASLQPARAVGAAVLDAGPPRGYS